MIIFLIIPTSKNKRIAKPIKTNIEFTNDNSRLIYKRYLQERFSKIMNCDHVEVDFYIRGESVDYKDMNGPERCQYLRLNA